MVDKVSSLVFLQYLTTVFDNIQDAVLLINVEPHGVYRLLLANQAFVQGSGHSEEVVGKEISEIVSPQSYKVLRKLYGTVVRTKQPLDTSEWFTVPLGHQAFEIKLIPILNTVGDCVQIAAITRNVTELYQLRRQVQQSAA